jgi:hypothetical protein
LFFYSHQNNLSRDDFPLYYNAQKYGDSPWRNRVV